MVEEKILVVSNGLVEVMLPGEGFLPSDEYSLTELSSQSFFTLRSEAEGNPSLRQLVPYVVLLRESEVFAVTRAQKQSESRLHHKLSIGIGGHLTEPSVIAGARRELNEELDLDRAVILQLVFLGFINDLSTAVSRDHLGCLYVCAITGEAVVREADKMWGKFRSLAYLEEHTGSLESWSQIALTALKQRAILIQ
jgi:predicted NUDIX family phosphoesterase